MSNLYNNELLNDILENEYHEVTNNFAEQFKGDDDMDILIRDIEALGYDSNDYDLELIEAIMDQLGYSLEGAIQVSDEYFCGYYDTTRDFIYELVNETVAIPKHLQFYIDYEKFERDLMLDYSEVQMSKGIAIIANH